MNCFAQKLIKTISSLFLLLAAILFMSSCGQINDPSSPASDITDVSGEQLETVADFTQLFPNNGISLCVFEQKEKTAQSGNLSINYSSLLLFDYEEKQYQRINLEGYTVHDSITPSAPVLWEDMVIVIEPGAFRSDAYTLFAEEAGRVFLADRYTGNVRILEPDSSWHLLGSPIFGSNNDPKHIYITACEDPSEETVLLRIDLDTGDTDCLGVYRDTERNGPRNQLPFSLKWNQADGYTYGYRGGDMQAQSLFRKKTGQNGDYELLIEDCYPEDYGMTVSAGFCVLEDKAYYYGVSATDHSVTLFCYNFYQKQIESTRLLSENTIIPVDRFGEYLILARPEQIRSGISFPVDGVRYTKEQDYMSGGTELTFMEKP